jgi:hypothetical protein
MGGVRSAQRFVQECVWISPLSQGCVVMRSPEHDSVGAPVRRVIDHPFAIH